MIKITICASLLSILLLKTDAYALDCQKNQVMISYDKSIKLIESQTHLLEKAMLAENVTGSGLADVFEEDLTPEKTKGLILALKTQNEAGNPLGVNYASLAQCLEQLAMVDRLESLKLKGIELNKAKLLFLKKNLSVDNSLTTSLENQNTISGIKEELSLEYQNDEKAKQKLEQNLLDEQSKSAEKINSRELNLRTYENNLIKMKIALLDKRISFNKKFQERIQYFEDISTKISKITKEFDSAAAHERLNLYVELEDLWVKVNQENLYRIFDNSTKFDFPTVIEFKGDLNSETEKMFKEMVKLRGEIQVETRQRKQRELKLLNDLVYQTGRFRSYCFSKLDFGESVSHFFSSNPFILIKNEVASSPYRFLSYAYSKYDYISETLSNGREGIMGLVYDVARIIFYIFSFFLIKVFINKAYQLLNRGQKLLLRKHITSNFFKEVSSFWNKVKGNFSEVVWLLIVNSLEDIESLEAYSFIFSIIKIILMTKLIRSFVVLFLGSICRIDSKSFQSFKRKAAVTAKGLGDTFLYYYLAMLFVSLTVGEVYIYSIVNIFILAILVYQILRLSSDWEEEFRLYLERKFSGIIVQKITHFLSYLPTRIQTLLVFIFIIVLSFLNWLVSFTENFEISKKISAKLFKKQIESVESSDEFQSEVPQEYQKEFGFSSTVDPDHYVSLDKNIENIIEGEVLEWHGQESDEHSLVVYGDKGIGKTTLLKHVSKDLEQKVPDLEVRYAKIPAKTITKKKLLEFMEKVFEGDMQEDESFDLLKIDARIQGRRVIIIDETQNSFLSQINGFEAYSELVNLVNLGTKNIFWMMSFNRYSWIFLDRAFGRTQYFRNIYELKGWDDTRIKDLIMKRHNKTNFKLSYDLLISATRSEDEIDRYASIESKFFKLLWEISRGNPRAAIYFWLTALSSKKKNMFNVNIPKELDLDSRDRIDDDLLFVLAYILKHENLSPREIEMSTNLPRGIVRNAIRVGLEKHFLFEDTRHRYMIDITAQSSLIRYLRLKNFIYGN